MFRRLLQVVPLVALLVPLTADGALAAPPSNDSAEGAWHVASLPSTVRQDTTEATTDTLEQELNDYCHGVTMTGAVWFTYTDATGTGITIDGTASDYSVGFMVFADDPRSGGLFERCGPGTVKVAPHPGQTFWIMAFSDQVDVPGGALEITFSEGPEAPTATVAIDPVADLRRDGSVRVTGTITCTGGGELYGQVDQPVGRFSVSGSFYTYPLTCDGTQQKWEGDATAYNGKFAGGQATVRLTTVVCNEVECVEREMTQQVLVRRAP